MSDMEGVSGWEKEKKTILIIVALSILLPTLDTFTDINLVVKLYRGAHYCEYANTHDDYHKCYDNADSYCSNYDDRAVCRFASHPTMAIAMLIPFLLNYFVCFITFLRKEKNKKFTFIFALLNIYPQFGENNHYKMNHWNNYFQSFRGLQDHQPPG